MKADTGRGALVPVCTPSITELEVRYATDAVRSGFISGTKGEYIQRFEEAFAKYCKAEHGIACNSGTAALQLAIRALKIKVGDEVIVPAFTNIATILCVVYVGAVPVLVDAREDTWCINEKLVEQKVTKRTKAIIPVHIYGHPVEMGPVMEVAKKHNLFVVEDAAEAHGAEYNGKIVGNIGDIGCFSFYANKIVTCGEGGMCVTDNKAWAEKMQSLRNLAFGDASRYLHTDLGYNYRMTNVQAAIGFAQMQRVDELVKRKRVVAAQYSRELRNVNGITTPCEMPWAKNVYWMYGILIDRKKFRISKDELMAELLKHGIETRSFFVPMQNQPVFRSLGLFRNDKCPVSDRLGREGLYLPSSTGLGKEEIVHICDVIKGLGRQ